MKILFTALAVVALAIGGLFYGKNSALQKGIAAAEREFAAYVPEKISDMGSVGRVTVTPLIDFHAASPDLKTEAGVSYLIEADSVKILFDVGYNAKREDPSPLIHNMGKLGVAMADIDIIVISHNHFDHVGGKEWMDGSTFSPGNEQSDLGAKRIYTPIDMAYPGQKPITTREPKVLDCGIATIGAIGAELIIGKTYEQSLAINIAGKGILLIVGCSHQTLPKIVKRTQDLFAEPIYGIIGGLHFPLPEGRLKFAGGLIDAQRLGSGNGPMDPLSEEDVNADIRMLKNLGIRLIGVGGHDSSDEIIELFKREFGEAHRYIKVGLPIET
jgi:metal-dependent hydrolase (beta-lactamase superfamily II)